MLTTIFRSKSQAHLDLQIKVFLNWGLKHKRITPCYKEWLELFAKHTHLNDVYDITDSDVALFKDMVYNTTISEYALIQATKAVSAFRNYYMTRTRPTHKRGRGKPPRVDMIIKAKELKGQGKTYRDIAFLLDSHLSLVYRWANYPLTKLKNSYPHVHL